MTNAIYLITVNYYSTDSVTQLVSSLSANPVNSYQLIIVNNSPEDRSIFSLQADSCSILDAQSNIGFGRACNLGLEWVYSRDSNAIVWIINPDAYVAENALIRANLFFSTHPEVSILGTVVYEPNGKIWFGEGEFVADTGEITVCDRITKMLSSDSTIPYIPAKWVTGCSLLIDLKHFSEVPAFDPDYFLYYEDFDFCQRYASQGYSIALTRELEAFHYPSSITGRNPHLKLRHSIYSYLLALEKHTDPSVLWTRFFRIALAAAIALPTQPQQALAKWQAILTYSKRTLKKWLIPS